MGLPRIKTDLVMCRFRPYSSLYPERPQLVDRDVAPGITLQRAPVPVVEQGGHVVGIKYLILRVANRRGRYPGEFDVDTVPVRKGGDAIGIADIRVRALRPSPR